MARDRHPNKEIEAAVQYAIAQGWRLEKCTGHAWGRLYCPQGDRSGCSFSVNSTPRSTQDHAKRIRRLVDRCPHAKPDETWKSPAGKKKGKRN